MLDPKVLLFPIVGSADMEDRLRGAMQVASSLGAHLRVIQSIVRPRQLLPDDLALPEGTLANLEVALDQHADDNVALAWESFQRVSAELGIRVTKDVETTTSTASWLQVKGLRSVSVARYGKVADLILISIPPDGRVTATLKAALLETGRPVLLLPRKLASFSLDRVLLAWNCTAPAARALYSALPLLRKSGMVEVVTSQECADRKPDAGEVAAHLMNHGISAMSQVIDCDPANAGPALIERAARAEASLIVMGAYSSHRVAELVFGGVTKHMVAHADIPILMSH